MARILVIDDDPSIVRVAERILKLDGHEVVTAATGVSALQECRTAPFDLVVTDVCMPGMDGMEMLVQFSREFPGLKIVVMSGGGDESDDVFVRAKRLGAVLTLPKPFTVDEMTQAIREALGKTGEFLPD